MKKLLDLALCEIQQQIQVYEYRRDKVKRNGLNSWKFWVRWRAASEFQYLLTVIDLLYQHKLRILDLMAKYQVDPLS